MPQYSRMRPFVVTNQNFSPSSEQFAGNATASSTTVPDVNLTISASINLLDTDSGLLPNRLTTAQISDITIPSEALLVYNTDTQNYQHYRGSQWNSFTTFASNQMGVVFTGAGRNGGLVVQSDTGGGLKDAVNYSIDGSGNLLVNSAGIIVDGTVNTTNLIVGTQTPASSSAVGVKGTITWNTSYIYVCTATNTWLRAPLSTW